MIRAPLPEQNSPRATVSTPDPAASAEPILLLQASHYIVAGSIGAFRSVHVPYHLVHDTGAGMNVIRTSTYHPQTNGQVDRYNRTVLAMLRCYVGEHQDDWDHYAPMLTYAYNNSVHRATGTTPFQLVLSNPPPSLIVHRSVTEANIGKTRRGRTEIVERLETAVCNARKRLTKAQERYKRDFDRNVRRANRYIKPGQYIYLDPQDGQKTAGKLGHVAVGPYRVLLNDGRTFVIQRGDVVERVNSDRVTYSPPPPDAPAPLPFAANTADIVAKNIDGRTYLVDKLLDHGFDADGRLQFLVKWSGYDEPSWQPRTDIPEELISRYFARERTLLGKLATRGAHPRHCADPATADAGTAVRCGVVGTSAAVSAGGKHSTTQGEGSYRGQEGRPGICHMLCSRHWQLGALAITDTEDDLPRQERRPGIGQGLPGPGRPQ